MIKSYLVQVEYNESYEDDDAVEPIMTFKTSVYRLSDDENDRLLDLIDPLLTPGTAHGDLGASFESAIANESMSHND